MGQQVPDLDLTEEELQELDFSDIEQQYAPDFSFGFDNVIVVDNVPKVGEAKKEKLLNVIRKIFSNIGRIKENGLHMPMDSITGESKGYMFIEFETAEQAALAVKQAHGFKMDKVHVLEVNKFDDVERYAHVEEEYREPEETEFKEKEHLKSWLGDAKARDQWVMLKGDDVSIYWNNKAEQPDLEHTRQNWSETYVAWSPKGTYLATFHKQGIALWGGPSWTQMARFPHPNVKLIDFSPNEKYITTWSHEGFRGPDGELHHVAIWDIITSRMLRSFPVATPSSQDAKSGGTMKIDWPMFKWSFDDKYVARMFPDMISVYETPGMGLLDKKSFKIKDVKSFEWSPSDHILSYWTPESGNIPARVTLQRVPGREIVRTKNLFNVIDCKLYWQNGGDYMLVRVDRAKTKKQTVTNFEIFRCREKDIPVDVVEVDSVLEVNNVYWEPHGTRFVVLAQENAQKTFCLWYSLGTAKDAAAKAKKGAAPSAVPQGVKLLKSTDAKGINQVFWSPKGRFLVLAGVRGFQGDIQFWDSEELMLMNTGEHYMCTDVEWDPTGRYVTTSVSWWRFQTDTGFMMWTFTGQMLTKQNVPVFKQLLWRPRPPTLLSEEEQTRIRKNLKEYSKQFEEEDTAQTKAVSREVVARRLKLWREWNEYVARVRGDYEADADERVNVWGFDIDAVNNDEAEGIEEWVEEVIEETEEIVD
ncbi:eukaryotic translation initiation factor eIF2A-domain-containing protein [Gaertneriomyces semiglobifer]|nr:eukaryotic translation initiation factor eIF2A-domain-containing protein [Gaertneriomyces semiglobifer]